MVLKGKLWGETISPSWLTFMQYKYRSGNYRFACDDESDNLLFKRGFEIT